MKIKSYRVYPKNDPSLWYTVEATSKRIARWCGANIINNNFHCFLTAKDIVAVREIEIVWKE